MRALVAVAAALGAAPGPASVDKLFRPAVHRAESRAVGPVRRWRMERVARPRGFKRITQGGRVCYRKRVRIDGRKVAVVVRRAS